MEAQINPRSSHFASATHVRRRALDDHRRAMRRRIERAALMIARECKDRARAAGLDYVFKASYDKANRSSHESFRGIGARASLDALQHVKEECGVPVLTDVHDISQIEMAAEVADILQIPAFFRGRPTDRGRRTVGSRGQCQKGHSSHRTMRATSCAGALRRCEKLC